MQALLPKGMPFLSYIGILSGAILDNDIDKDKEKKERMSVFFQMLLYSKFAVFSLYSKTMTKKATCKNKQIKQMSSCQA